MLISLLGLECSVLGSIAHFVFKQSMSGETGAHSFKIRVRQKAKHALVPGDSARK